MENKFKMPTEIVELPSQGLVYSELSPLSSGKIEMKYMTAREEDILTNQNYISKGTVLDELVKSLIVSDVDYGDLIVGDKNAVLVAARILGYGKDYTFTWGGETQEVDLTTIENKPLDIKVFKKGQNEFNFTLPHSGIPITFKLLTHGDEKAIDRETEGLKKINKDESRESTTRLKYTITSINGSREQKDIRGFVDQALLARDARVLREYINKINPDVELKFKYTDTEGREEVVDLPIGLNFFWPDA